jgi:hypothetical protein
VQFEWDEAKRRETLRTRGLDFADLARFDWAGAVDILDDRSDYGEERHVAVGRLDGRLLVIAYTMRGEIVRIISLRKANAREQRRHAERTAGR